MHCGAEVTESSTNKQHHLSLADGLSCLSLGAPLRCPHLSSHAMVQMTIGAKAPKEPPDSPPAQATTHVRPRTAGRHHDAQLLTRSPSQRLHASESPQLGTRPTHAARPRRQAPPPRTHAGAHAPAAHPRRTRAPRTYERPEHARPGTYPARPRKQTSLHPAAARARHWQQDHGQCTWHGIGRLSPSTPW